MRRQIIISLALIFLLFVIGSGVAIYNLSSTTANLRHLISLHEIEDIRQDLNLSTQRVLNYVHAPENEFIDNLNELIDNIHLMDKAINRCHTCHHEPDVQAELDEVRDLGDRFEERLSYMITTVNDSPWRQENKRLADQYGSTMLNKVQDMVSRAAMTIQRQTDQAMVSIDRSHSLIIITLMVTFLAAFIIAQILTRNITRPIDALVHAARKITEGEVGFHTDFKAPAEFGELIDTFNEMSRALAEKEQENRRLTESLQQKVEELQRTQKQLVETEKLTALGTLAGGIAHDFNNILCGIISNITVLKREEPDGTPRHALLDTIEQAGFRAADLVQQLLTFARQEVACVKLLSINTHINNVLKLIQASLPSSIQLTLDLEKELPMIHGDPTRIEQVIMNLCLNARDAMADGGELTLRTRLVHLDRDFCRLHPEAEEGDYITIDVADTGHGMDDTVKSRLFEPFFTTKPFGRGTGLGLAMVHGIVKSHQGFCLVDSDPGQGARFTIYLPLDSPLAGKASADDADACDVPPQTAAVAG